MSGNRFTVHNRLASETDTHPFTKIACGLKFGHIGHDHIGDIQGIHDLVDEPMLGLSDDSITFGCGNNRRQIGVVRLVATRTGDTEAIGQFVNRCALLLVNVVIVEDPIQCIKVLKQCFIGARIDVSPENDDRLELQYGGALGVPRTARMGPMKRSKFSEEQVAYALRQAESGTVVGDVCRQVGISEATFYAWKKKYAHLGVNEVRRLRQLEEENTRLKRLVADLSLDKHMLSEALRKKV